MVIRAMLSIGLVFVTLIVFLWWKAG